jgi:hypothetical protein
MAKYRLHHGPMTFAKSMQLAMSCINVASGTRQLKSFHRMENARMLVTLHLCADVTLDGPIKSAIITSTNAC